MNDMHVHTLHSHDSHETLDAYTQRAMQIGVNAICFTDHVDNNPADEYAGFFDSTAFFTAFDSLAAKAQGFKPLAGMEFDCPHRFSKQLAELARLPFDCIIGGVHYCNLQPDLFFPELKASGVTAEQCYAAYWPEVLSCVQAGGFDVLAHIDMPKRYYGELLYDEQHLAVVFQEMLSNGIILEVNTSSLRRGLAEPMPGLDLLKLYRDLGGRYVTIASDAHQAADLASGYAEARKLADSLGLREVTFKQRQMVPA